jgi:chaperonin GroES
MAQFLKSKRCINKIKINKIMALNIKPLSDRVLIEPVAAETKTASGILFRYRQEKPQKELLLQLEMALKNIR